MAHERVEETAVEEIPVSFGDLSATFDTGRTRKYEHRVAQLRALRAMVKENEDAFVAAMRQDLRKVRGWRWRARERDCERRPVAYVSLTCRSPPLRRRTWRAT